MGNSCTKGQEKALCEIDNNSIEINCCLKTNQNDEKKEKKINKKIKK